MNAPVRSAPADRAASASSPRAKDVEPARARVAAGLARAMGASAPEPASRADALRALTRRPLVRVALFVAALLALTLLGARVGARSPAPMTMPSPKDLPSATSIPVESLPEAAPVASASGGTPDPPPLPSAGTLPDGRVVLNLATEDDLSRLPHIGPSRARAILALRQKLGKFHTVSELLRVKGLGRKTLAKLAPRLLVDPPKDPEKTSATASGAGT